MKIKYSPQRSDSVINYNFEIDKITVTINDESDMFDFSTFGNGKAENIETSLPVNPIVSAERIDGVLQVELLNYISENATEEERFPEWQEV